MSRAASGFAELPAVVSSLSVCSVLEFISDIIQDPPLRNGRSIPGVRQKSQSRIYVILRLLCDIRAISECSSGRGFCLAVRISVSQRADAPHCIAHIFREYNVREVAVRGCCHNYHFFM
jgi:hypothetical protein